MPARKTGRVAVARPRIGRRPCMQPPGPERRAMPEADNEPPRPADDPAAGPPRVECVVGETLCRVRVLSEAEWDALPPERRPRTAERFPGLGWVVATAGRDD